MKRMNSRSQLKYLILQLYMELLSTSSISNEGSMSIRDMLATGCGDGIVRVFDVSNPKSPAIHTLKGHTSKVFNIVWHPHFNYIFASTSDDKTIRVWDIKIVTPLFTIRMEPDNLQAIPAMSELLLGTMKFLGCCCQAVGT